ncbi:MAG: type IV secretion system family protein [Gammaproteobacteria bacterium]|nr:MAG: type IV secretion system family protein [Gammaproteobacteria bacterium]
MRNRVLLGVLLAAFSALGVPKPAHAQFAVIDVASLGQLIQQVSTLEQQVATARSQLSQAQSEYAAITGSRGMHLLLTGVNRNYLPANWGELSQVMSGASARFPALSADVSARVAANAVLTPAQVASLSPTQQAQLAAARQSPAMLQAIARAALANSSDRFASLEQLISAIGGATDPKASLDLTARITAEQGMLQNEQTKLQLLFQVAESEERARAQRLREQAMADQGSLRRLPPMGL